MRTFIIKHLKRKFVIWIVCFLLVSLFGYLAFNSYNVYSMTSENYRAGNIDAIGRSVDSLFLDINDFPQQEGNDILYAGKINSLHDLLNSGDVDFEENRKKLIRDFMNFMEVNPSYYQLRYIDEKGIEVVRLENDGEALFVVEDDNLQDKMDRYYYENVMILDEEEIYISRLDLNMEDGVLENRGTEENPEYVPVIRYAMPVFDDKEARKGFLIFNIYADYFLENIRRTNREGAVVFLVDNNGYYMAHSNKSKEFSSTFGREDRIDIDYPDVGLEILENFDKRFIETEDYIFTFRHLYPAIGTFEVYQGSRKIFGDHPEEEQYWVLVSISDARVVNGGVESIRRNFIMSAVFSAFILLLVILLLFVILAMNGSLKT